MNQADFSQAVWRKSSRSNANSSCVEVAFVWRKSSRSSANSSCVEVAFARNAVALRDSKNKAGPVLLFASEQWRAFVDGNSTGR